jgi:mono/diheme cytochrome c family protein
MSSSNQNPELDAAVGATAAGGHMAPEPAACTGENQPVSNGATSDGNEPVSLAVLTVCGVVLLIAGGILGSAGRFFDYQTLFREGYVRTPPPGTTEQGPPPKPALEAFMAKGAKIYGAKCIVCHGPEAKGDGANFPALAGSTWATGETQRFAMIVLNGLQGPMSTGKTYGAGMPSQSLPPVTLTPEDLAGVMTYVRNHFGNNTGDIVTVDMAKAAFTISAARPKTGQQITADELTADHLKPLPGSPLDPKAMVDPITLTPVRAPKP